MADSTLHVTFPELLRFANNPILVKAYSTRTGVDFLKIKCCVTAAVVQPNGYEWLQDYEFSKAVGVTGQLYTFDLSKVARTAVEQAIYPALGYNPSTSASGSVRPIIQLKVFLYEEYLLDNVVVPATPPYYNIAPAGTFATIQVLSGGFTDFERYTRLTEIENVNTFIGAARYMSRKPNDEIIPLGEMLVAPYMLGSTAIFNFKLEGSNDSEIQLTNAPSYCATSIAHRCITPGAVYSAVRQYGSTTVLASGRRAFVEQIRAPYYLFQFINGFGCWESIVCYPRAKEQYTMDTSEYFRNETPKFDQVNNRYAVKTVPQNVLSMSSGTVSKAWADWFVSEFLASRKHVMKVGNVFVPVVVIPDDKTLLADRAKSERLHIDFDVKYSFSGSVNTTF